VEGDKEDHRLVKDLLRVEEVHRAVEEPLVVVEEVVEVLVGAAAQGVEVVLLRGAEVESQTAMEKVELVAMVVERGQDLLALQHRL
jgi:hypothetical protein